MEDFNIETDIQNESLSIDYTIHLDKIVETNYYIIGLLSLLVGIIVINSIFNNLKR